MSQGAPGRSVVEDLAKYADKRVVQNLVGLARTSESASLRRAAIYGLSDLGDQPSLLALASLLDVAFPKGLKADGGWKLPPDFREYFPATIVALLKERTQQDFGSDRGKWEEWIRKNVE